MNGTERAERNRMPYTERLRRYDADKRLMYRRLANETYQAVETELQKLVEKWKI